MRITKLLAVFLTVLPSIASAVSITTFGELIYDHTGLISSRGTPKAISGDGRTIIGEFGSRDRVYRDGQQVSVPWLPLPDGVQPEYLATQNQTITSTSYDGSIIVGIEDRRFSGYGDPRGFIYQNGQTTAINNTEGLVARGLQVSNDGSTIIGFHQESYAGTPVSKTYKYQNGEFTPLGSLNAGDQLTYAFAVSGDGSKIVGTERNWDTKETAGFIHQNGTMSEIPVSQEGYFIPNAISSDGSTIVGSRIGSPSGAAAIHVNGATVDLVDDGKSQVFDVSADGSTIVGRAPGLLEISQGSTDYRDFATIWEGDGQGGYTMQSLEDKLFMLGVDITDYGFAGLSSIVGVSDDGNVFIGTGTFSRYDGRLVHGLGFVVDLTPTTVPVPAAVWFFLSALGGLLGATRIGTKSKRMKQGNN